MPQAQIQTNIQTLEEVRRALQAIVMRLPSRLVPTDIKTTAYSADFGELVLADSGGGDFTVTLPPISAENAGLSVAVKYYRSPASGTVAVVGSGNDTIDKFSSGSVNLTTTWKAIVFVSDGVSDWIRVADLD